MTHQETLVALERLEGEVTEMAMNTVHLVAGDPAQNDAARGAGRPRRGPQSGAGIVSYELDLFLRYEDETMANLSPSTVQRRQNALLAFARFLRPRTLLEATSGDISTFIDGLGFTAAKSSERVGQLHMFYNWLLNQGIIDRDPAAPLYRQRFADHLRRPAGDRPGMVDRPGTQSAIEVTIQGRGAMLRRVLRLAGPQVRR